MEISDSCLRINGFVDPWLDEKLFENNASLAQFCDRLDEIDRLVGKDKWLEIFRGVFAGNIFDWGALEVAKILENDLSYGMESALKQIQPRPWLIDGMDAWLERVEVNILHMLQLILSLHSMSKISTVPGSSTQMCPNIC